MPKKKYGKPLVFPSQLKRAFPLWSDDLIDAFIDARQGFTCFNDFDFKYYDQFAEDELSFLAGWIDRKTIDSGLKLYPSMEGYLAEDTWSHESIDAIVEVYGGQILVDC